MRPNREPYPLSRFLLASVCTLTFTVGCAGETGQEGISSEEIDGAEDTEKVDAGAVGDDVPTGTDTATAEDTSTPVEDTADNDTGISQDAGPSCPGDPGCTCAENKDCDKGFCIETPAGFKCAETCVDSCVEGFKCVSSGGTDSTSICVPRWGRMCNPCTTNTDCQLTGNTDAACVDRGNAGAFCGSACSEDGDCAAGYACEAGKDVNGKDVKQCVVKDNGACKCSAQAITQELSTTCYIAAGEGKCAGKRTCLPNGTAGAPTGGGLTACKAPEPAPEQCDAKDNDCDGQTDESTCDDDNPCTTDECGGGEGCKHSNQNGDCDADGSLCTEKDSCSDGNCKVGTPLDCDDANPCTTDTCDAKKGCEHQANSGNACDADNNPCTIADTCKDGICEAGKKRVCDASDQCLSGNCSIVTGKCNYTPLTALPCNDGNPCTTGEACTANETCTSKTITDCDDSNPCTADSCDVNSGCKHKNAANKCDDGDACTESDGCEGGNCVGLALNVTTTCNDNNPCTTDTCSKTKGCENSNDDTLTCDDGNPCSEGDKCTAGKCIAGQVNSCDCNTDTDCAKKEDGNACNGTLICDKSKAPFKCAVDESSVVKCDDSLNNACQTMGCDPSDGKCSLDKKSTGAACDADGSACTVKDACADGKCVPGTVLKCNDDNACTDDTCDKEKGCIYAPNTSFCDADGDKCTQGDKCGGGVCVAGEKKTCKDTNDCTADLCAKDTGFCVFTPLTVACDDGDACTKDESCGKHPDTGLPSCLGGKQVECTDGNPCTKDSCSAAKGCEYAPLFDGAPCDDGNKCTDPDGCTTGQCQGKPLDVATACDDGNPCTKDTCTSAEGCQHSPLSSGKCEDGNVCTEGDSCQAGKCAAGTNTCGCTIDSDCKPKEDGNVCNGVLFCDKAKAPFQCAINPATIVKCDDSQDNFCGKNNCGPTTGKCTFDTKQDDTPCDADDSVCTPKDVCKDGKCAAGKLLNCDDNNVCTADTCDAKLGCQKTSQGGKCDADGDECTGPDICKDGKCEVGEKNDCDDSESCTADSCNTTSGKCENKPLTQSCDDGNKCTTGDACATEKGTGKYTCVPTGKTDCDDATVCTVDTCDATTGCKHEVDIKTAHACYSGSKETRGVGACKDGKAFCKADGTLDTCTGDVKPAAKDICDNQNADDNCDGTTDEGCAPTAAHLRIGNGVVSGKGDKYGVNASIGVSAAASLRAGPASGAKYGGGLGWYQWLSRWVGK